MSRYVAYVEVVEIKSVGSSRSRKKVVAHISVPYDEALNAKIQRRLVGCVARFQRVDNELEVSLGVWRGTIELCIQSENLCLRNAHLVPIDKRKQVYLSRNTRSFCHLPAVLVVYNKSVYYEMVKET